MHPPSRAKFQSPFTRATSGRAPAAPFSKFNAAVRFVLTAVGYQGYANGKIGNPSGQKRPRVLHDPNDLGYLPKEIAKENTDR